MLRKHYMALVTKAEAEKFWKLRAVPARKSPHRRAPKHPGEVGKQAGQNTYRQTAPPRQPD